MVRRTVGTAVRRLRLEPGPVDHPLARSRLQSPLRYPGAKSRLIPAISTLVANAATHRSVRTVDLFVEPFAGGASVSLALVGAGLVERVLLADADPLVASFWQGRRPGPRTW
jgi:site-specific DNA-adenine methylase